MITKYNSISGIANELGISKNDSRKIIDILVELKILNKYNTMYKCIKMPTEINEILTILTTLT